MYSYSTQAPFLCMFLLACCISQTPTAVPATEVDRWIIRWRYKVHVVNGFADNAKPLVVRCRSNDDYLGEHTLWQGQEFRFKFGLKFLSTTHFVCYFEWGSKTLYGITVFKIGKETKTCKATGNCFWKATEDGLYFSNNYQNWEKRFDWH